MNSEMNSKRLVFSMTTKQDVLLRNIARNRGLSKASMLRLLITERARADGLLTRNRNGVEQLTQAQ